MGRVRRLSHKWWRDESGTTGFSLMWLALCVITGGLCVDISNSYRVKQQMSVTADAAALAGAIAIAKGSDEAAVRAAILASVESNMPAQHNGTMISDSQVDIQLLNFDTEVAAFAPADEDDTYQRNTAFVQLHRNNALGNGLSFLLLQMSDAFDRDGQDYDLWDISARSVASFTPSILCDSTNWVYARGRLQVTSGNYFGPRYCLHGQKGVQLSMGNEFDTDAGVSMPDLKNCEKCVNGENPGIEGTLFERSLVMDDTRTRITRLTDDFMSGGAESQKFFAARPLDGDLGLLPLYGYDASTLSAGSVVTLTRTQFDAMDHIPAGLTYVVPCLPGGNKLSLDAPSSGTSIQDIVLISGCGFHFTGAASIESAILISTQDTASDSITADSGTRIGTAASACQPERHTHIYGLGAMSVPARFAASNVTIRVSGDIHIAAASNGNYSGSYGLSLYTDGDLHLTSGHAFNSCTSEGMGLREIVGGFRLMPSSPQYYAPQVAQTN